MHFNLSGSHSELVKDCNGAYSQLIRLQEIASVSEQKETIELVEEIAVDSLRNSSQRMSFRRSISQGSSTGSNSHRSSSVAFGLPAGAGILEMESEKPANNSLLATTKSPRNVSLRRVAYLNKPEIPVLVLGTLAAAANGAIIPMFSILVSGVIKTFDEPRHELRKGTKFWALIFVALGLASLLVHPMRAYFFTVAGCKLIARVRTMCFEKVVHMEISWFDEVEHSSGAIGARLCDDAAALKILVGDALGLIVQNIATAIAGLAIAFAANWQLAFIILSLFPFFGINGYIQMKFMAGFSADAKVTS